MVGPLNADMTGTTMFVWLGGGVVRGYPLNIGVSSWRC